MRRLVLLMAVLLLSAGVALAQKTPPGGDMVGSDRPGGRSDVRSAPTASPDANQQLTGTTGSSSGYEQNPAFAGSSTYGTASSVNNDRSGMQGQTTATAARRRAYRNRRSTAGNQRAAPEALKKGQKTKPKAEKPEPQGDVPY